jgi:branched-chain amino acid transport system ATP-binding protein
MGNMLVVEELRVAYGSAGDVLRGISLIVPENSIVALIGANGAGKTTLLNTISGLLNPKSGSIYFMDEEIGVLPPERIIRKGITQVPEGRKIFSNLTVYENLLMGGLSRSDKAGVKADIERMYISFPRLKERRNQMAGTLSGGEQQMLAFARALVSGPALLLLDEPSMGLAPLFVEEVANLIVDIRKEGKTVLLVEQNAQLALSISDKGYVLETGEIVIEGVSQDLLENEVVQASYLGM